MNNRLMFRVTVGLSLVYWVVALAATYSTVTGPGSITEMSVLAMQMTGVPFVYHLARTFRGRANRNLKGGIYLDDLTGLPNRSYFTNCLEEALEAATDRRAVAVLYLDLDRFKVLNDTLGHAAGDRALFEVSLRLRRQLKAGFMVARMGGDEFGLLLEGLKSERDAESVAESMLQCLDASFPVQGHEVVVNGSIGMATAFGGASADELMRRADVALYQAKADGRGCWRAFRPEMSAPRVEMVDLGSGLRRAVARDELTLYYQPQVSLATGRTESFEALVRWQHPDRGLLSPAAFIPSAEEAGMIRALGKWIMRHACEEAAEWMRRFPDHPNLGVSVNVSPLEFRDPELVLEVQRTLVETGLPARNLEIEIVETALMTDIEGTLATLNAFRAMGIRLAVDDFGTGYSSLSYLRKFPIDTLKIDRSFLLEAATDRRTLAIVESMVSLAHALGIEVTAEGVETTAQLSLLMNAKCDRAQGYLLARPLPREAVQHYLASQTETVSRPAPEPQQLVAKAA